MKNKLHLVEKTGRLTCVWVATGEAKMSMTCVWIAAGTPSASAVNFNSEEVRMHLCAYPDYRVRCNLTRTQRNGSQSLHLGPGRSTWADADGRNRYLILMTLMLGYHMLDLAGVVHKIF
jgi:hypothetical protein